MKNLINKRGKVSLFNVHCASINTLDYNAMLNYTRIKEILIDEAYKNEVTIEI